MKDIAKYLLVVILFFHLLSCEKDIIPDGRFIGKWTILTIEDDTISFNSESSFTRKFHDDINHHFDYSYNSDSITIQYTGPNKILVHPSTHYYELTNNELLIDFSNDCYGFDSSIYKFTRIE